MDDCFTRRLTGEEHELTFDMAMLLPPFAGVGLRAFDGSGGDITALTVRAQRIHEGGCQLHPEAL